MKTITISDETYERLKDELEPKERSLWLPKNKEDIYYYVDYRSIYAAAWDGGDVDKNRFALGNIFKTEEEAKAHSKYLQALYEVKKWIAENCEAFEPDWSDMNQIKYSIYSSNNRLNPDYSYDNKRLFILPYLKSEEECEALIKAQEDNLKILFGVK
jgi:hypothetical protein